MTTLSAWLARRASRIRVDLPLALLDALLVAAGYFGVLALRFDGAIPARRLEEFAAFLPLALLVHVGSHWVWGLYGQVWRHASVAEARRLLLSGACSSLLLFVTAGGVVPWGGADGQLAPRSVIVLGAAVVTMLVGAVRFQSRLFALNRAHGTSGLRVLVVGAGDTGGALIREMLRNRDLGLTPAAVLDDNPRLKGLQISGVGVVGTIADLPSAVSRYRAHQVLLAVPGATQQLVRSVAALAEQASVPLKVVPPMKDFVTGRPSVRDLREVRIEDLLGREEVDIDLHAVRGVIRGRTVLVTGAGGSIGSEIARQIGGLDPELLVLLDHDETHLFDAAGLLSVDRELVLADIRDERQIRDVFARFRPEVVFHAAAHKHVPLLEAHPAEAVLTNVVGTWNVAAAAADARVERFVFISTDKAVRPSSVMGASKWVGEQAVHALAPAGRPWCAVRFGNVLGSRGSVIPTFTRQIEAGGPVTVTDPRMTRYFMSVREAVRLVLQAAALSEGRDIFMLEMGEAVNIMELAQRMIRLSGREPGVEVEIRVVGMRPGEKLEEELRAPDEAMRPTTHPSVLAIAPVALPTDAVVRHVQALAAAARQRDDEALRPALLRLAGSPLSVEHDVIDLRGADGPLQRPVDPALESYASTAGGDGSD